MYKEIESSGSNLFEGYIKYKSNSEKIRIQSEDMYFYLAERRLLSDFGRFLFKKKLIKHHESFSKSCNNVLFNPIIGFAQHTTLVRYRKYLNEFEKYRKTIKD